QQVLHRAVGRVVGRGIVGRIGDQRQEQRKAGGHEQQAGALDGAAAEERGEARGQYMKPAGGGTRYAGHGRPAIPSQSTRLIRSRPSATVSGSCTRATRIYSWPTLRPSGQSWAK